MMSGVIVAVLIGTLSISAGAQASELRSKSRPSIPEVAPAFTLDAFVSEVEKNWPRMKAVELERQVADGEVMSAEGGFDVTWKTKGTVRPAGYYQALLVESLLEKPTSLWGTSAFAGWRLGTGEFAVYDGKQQTLEYGELLAGLNVPLWRDGPIDDRRMKLKRAELGRKLAELSITEQQILLRRAAAHAYWDWIAAGRVLTIFEQLIENLKVRAAALEERVERGALARVELKDNARALAQRQNQITSARRAWEQAEMRMSLFLRGSELAPTATLRPNKFPEAEAQVPVGPSSIEEAKAVRPEVEQLALRLRQNEVEGRLLKNQAAPGVDLRILGSQDFGPSMASRPDLSDPVLEVSVLVDVPLQRRSAHGRAQSTSAKASQLRWEQALTLARIEVEVRSAEVAVTAALEAIDAAREEVALATELEQAERTRFESGASTLVIVNLREQQTAEALLREAAALSDYHKAVADLRASQGK